MEIHQIRAFLAVAEELHFGRAAERLHIAQPPLSRTIKTLERQLSTRLFDRSTRSVSLTATGHAFLEPAREVMESLRRAELAVQLAGEGETGLIRIAYAGLSTHGLVAQLARTVRSQTPGIQLELYSQNFAQPAMRKLLDDRCDIALGRWDVVPPAITCEVVRPDSLVVALPDTHPLAGMARISITDLAAESFITLPPHEGSVLPDRLRRLAQAHGYVPDVVQVVPDTQTALALVSAEVGCHLTLRSVALSSTDPHVSFIDLADETEDVDLRAAWRQDDRGPALAVVVRALRELVASE